MTRIAVALARLAIGLLAAAAVLVELIGASPVQFWNFFGLFTIQANLLVAVVLCTTGVLTLIRAQQSPLWRLLRGYTTTAIVVVSVVYNLLLAGPDGGLWRSESNIAVHFLVPLLTLLDWIIVADRAPLPWRLHPLVLVHPAIWIVVVLIRGMTDGWVPYPFLAPSTGYSHVLLYCVGIVVTFAAVGAGVWAASRLRFLRLRAA